MISKLPKMRDMQGTDKLRKIGGTSRPKWFTRLSTHFAAAVDLL